MREHCIQITLKILTPLPIGQYVEDGSGDYESVLKAIENVRQTGKGQLVDFNANVLEERHPADVLDDGKVNVPPGTRPGRLTFASLSREVLEEEIIRCNDIMVADGKRIAALRTVAQALLEAEGAVFGTEYSNALRDNAVDLARGTLAADNKRDGLLHRQPPQPTQLEEFAKFVLERLSNDKDWSSDTTDDISQEAIGRGLATLDADDYFVVVKQPANAS